MQMDLGVLSLCGQLLYMVLDDNVLVFIAELFVNSDSISRKIFIRRFA